MTDQTLRSPTLDTERNLKRSESAASGNSKITGEAPRAKEDVLKSDSSIKVKDDMPPPKKPSLIKQKLAEASSTRSQIFVNPRGLDVREGAPKKLKNLHTINDSSRMGGLLNMFDFAGDSMKSHPEGFENSFNTKDGSSIAVTSARTRMIDESRRSNLNDASQRLEEIEVQELPRAPSLPASKSHQSKRKTLTKMKTPREKDYFLEQQSSEPLDTTVPDELPDVSASEAARHSAKSGLNRSAGNNYEGKPLDGGGCCLVM